MQLSKRALLSALVASAYSFCPLFADDLPTEDAGESEDFKAIRDYIDTKRNISVQEKGGSLRIGGDVRVQYKRVHQVADGQKVESDGQGGGRKDRDTNLPQNQGDVEASLSFEYVHDTSYADVLFKFKNNMGLDGTNYKDIDSPESDRGSCNAKSTYAPTDSKISLARAVIGDELWSQDSHKIVGEIGRQRLYDLYDSRVMFFNRFDGIALKYTGAFEGIGKAHFTYGGFLVSDRISHYVNSFEMGLSQILDTSFSAKYAFIDWERSGKYSDGSDASQPDNAGCNGNSDMGGTNANYAGMNRLFRYKVSQISASYYVPSELVGGKALRVYAAYAYNHAAKTMRDYFAEPKNDRNQTAWYAGFTLGRIQMPSDWLLDLNYQYVGAQSVPELDTLGGAGRGNLRNVWQFMNPAQGYTNYKGLRAQFSYCLSADMMLNLKGSLTRAADNRLTSLTLDSSSRNKYSCVEAEIIYSF